MFRQWMGAVDDGTALLIMARAPSTNVFVAVSSFLCMAVLGTVYFTSYKGNGGGMKGNVVHEIYGGNEDVYSRLGCLQNCGVLVRYFACLFNLLL